MTLFSHQHMRPQYGEQCFSEIPALISSLLTGSDPTRLMPAGFSQLPTRYERIIVLFLDAFGWNFFERCQDDYPFLRRFAEQGSVTRLTSQFPSTTAAHVTTLYTGLPVGQHGVFEWFYYEPLVDGMIAPLLFSWAGDQGRETLHEAGIEPASILPAGTVAPELSAQGVSTFVFQPKAFAHSSYSAMMCQGAEVVGYTTLPEALVNIRRLLDWLHGPACLYLYFGDIDSICHTYGPDSPQVAAELDASLTLLERWLQRDMVGQVDRTLLMLIADHGQAAVDPATTIYVNQLPEFPRLRPMLRVNRRGQFLVPGGSPRDLFMYVQETALEEAQALLAQALADRADVIRVADLVDRGYFGPTPVSSTLLARLGNLVILPHAGETVFWYEKDRFEQKYYGHHGGLSPDEMEIPLLFLPLGVSSQFFGVWLLGPVS